MSNIGTAKRHPKYMDWLTTALKAHMLHNVDTNNYFDEGRMRPKYEAKILQAKSLGELVDIMYYEYALWNDASMLHDALSEAADWRRDKDYMERCKVKELHCECHTGNVNCVDYTYNYYKLPK